MSRDKSQVEHSIELALNCLSETVQGYPPTITQIRRAQDAVYALQRTRRRLYEIRSKLGKGVSRCIVCGREGIDCTC